MAMPAPEPRTIIVERRSGCGPGCLVGCLALLLICVTPVILAGGYTAWYLATGFKRDPVLRLAGELVREDGLARQVMGPGAVITGMEGNYFSFMPWSERSAFAVTLEGPRGEGHLAVTAHGGMGGPKLDSAILTGPDGRRYNLLKHEPLPGDPDATPDQSI